MIVARRYRCRHPGRHDEHHAAERAMSADTNTNRVLHHAGRRRHGKRQANQERPQTPFVPRGSALLPGHEAMLTHHAMRFHR
jgi:hypothetical protein